MILEISKEERQILLRAVLLHAPTAHVLTERLMELRDGQSLPAVPLKESGSPVGLSHAPSVSNPPGAGDGALAPRESVRWSTAKFDKDAVEQITLTPAGCKRDDVPKAGKTIPRMTISWQNRQGRGYLYAAVWDESLFAWVASRVRQETLFYVVHQGKYTNIVGVKA